MTISSSLRYLLASAHTAEALEQLTAWAQSQSPVWRQAALLLQASCTGNERVAAVMQGGNDYTAISILQDETARAVARGLCLRCAA